MKKVLNILILLFQLGWTVVGSICIYMLFAILDYEGGIEGLLGLTIFQPLFAIILSGLTISGCVIIGLPIRLNKRVHRWWPRKFYIPVIGISCGLILLLLSLFPGFHSTVSTQGEGGETIKQIPNILLASTGWLLTIFFALHLFPPPILIRRLEKFQTNI